jgi:hypothetical protein
MLRPCSRRSPAASCCRALQQNAVALDARSILIRGRVDRSGVSSRCRRSLALLLIGACGSGCHVWRTEPVTRVRPIADRHTAQLRITRNDGSLVIVAQPMMRGDTLLGTVLSNRSTADSVRIPLSDVREVATRRASAWRTVSLVTGVTAGALFAAYAVLVEIACAAHEC